MAFWTAGQDGGSTLQIRYVASTTDVEFVKVGVAQSSIYDLQGRKIEKAQNGIYIIDGEKVIVK